MNLNHHIRRKINRLTAKWRAVVMICAAWMLTILPAAAQTIHPVTASLQLVPPYSVYLADYAAPGNDKLRVILTLNDLSQPSYTIRLRIRVELNGRTVMQTDPAWRPSGITLLPGMPQVITGSQLHEYLVTGHLQFLDGFNRDNYERTKALPEGAYRICVTAYDYYRNDNVAVSNEGCNIFFFQKKEPPVLNSPLCNTRVDRKDPQFLTFNWSMRNTPSPFAGALGTGYRFELFEVRPAGSNPEYIVRSSKPIYTTTTDGLMLVYGPGEPQLLDSMQYVWRVQAFDKDGRDAYQNNGYSPACVFTYGGIDPFMAGNVGKPELFGESLGERSGKWWWHTGNGATVDGWNIQYRKQVATGNKDDVHEWNKQYVTDTLLHLFSLEPENVYEARVQATIRGITGSWSETTVFRTLPKRVYECGKNDTAAFGLGQAGAGQPLNSAVAGMVIRVGDFDMQLLQVSGGNGRFTGYGAVATPLLGLRLNVKFTDAVINDRLQLTQGDVIALSDGIDAWIKETKEYFRGGDEVGKVVTGDIEPTFVTELPILSEDAIRYDSLLQTIVITNKQTGQTETLDIKGKDMPVIIEDNDGDLFQVDKDGKVKKLGKRNSGFANNNTPQSLNKLHSDKATIVFSKGKDNQYAFDEWRSAYAGKDIVEGEYEKLDDGKYRVPAKAIVPGGVEQVQATLNIKDASIKPEKVKFVTAKGIEFLSERNGNNYTVTITGGPAGDAQELYAVHAVDSIHYITLGKLLVVSYAPQKHDVVLITVGKAAINKEAVSQKLNKIYNPVGISYEVVLDESFRENTDWDANGNKVLDISASGLFSNGPTGEMKAMIEAYRKNHTIDEHSAYLFVLDESSKEELAGEMPRGEQFGYVFVKNTGEAAITRTIGHELGHGRYKLEHAFDKNIGLQKGATDNLMDYSSDELLVKFQWDAIHDPGVVWGAFEGDDDGHDVVVSNYLGTAMLNKDNLYYSFLTPDGKKIYLPKGTKRPVFAYSIDDPQNYKLVAGTLVGFTLVDGKNETKYTAKIVNNVFSGYFSDQGTEYKPVVPADATKESLVMLFPNTASTFRSVKFKLPANKLKNYTALDNGAVPVMDERALAKEIKLFSSDVTLDVEKTIRANDALLNGLYDNLWEEEIEIIEDAAKSPELLPLLKAAAWKKLYNLYYTRYTSGIELGIFCSSANGGQQCRIWEKQDPKDVLMELWDKNRYEFYCVFLDSIRNYCSRYEGGRTDVIKDLSEKSDWGAVINAFAGLNDVEMQALSLEKRVLLVKFAVKNGVSDYYSVLESTYGAGFENVLVRLFKTTPDGQKNRFLDSLAGARDFDKKYSHLLAALSKDGDGLDGDEWKTFATTISEWIFTYKPRKETFSITNHVTNKQVLVFDNSKGLYVLEKLATLSSLITMIPPDQFSSHYSLTEEFTDAGKIKMSSYKGGLLFKVDNRTVEKPPYEYVFIYFKDDHILSNGYKISKGAILPVPAFMVYSLFNDVNTGRIIVGMRTTADIALMFVGIGELNAAIRLAEGGAGLLRSWRFYKSLADLTVSAADLIINDALGDKLEKDTTGQKILFYWNIASMTYSFSRLSYEGIAALRTYSKGMDAAVAEFKNNKKLAESSEEAQKLEKLRKALAEMADAAADAGGLISRLKKLKYQALLNKLNELDDISLARFLDDFEGAADVSLETLNQKTYLVDFWKRNRDVYKNRRYPGVDHRDWQLTKGEIIARNDPNELKLLNAMDGKGVSNSQVALAGAYSPHLTNPEVVLRTNLKPEFNVNTLEPELRESLEYMEMIWADRKAGNLYKKLYNNVPFEKLDFANKPGIHAEVLAINDVIKQLKHEGKFKSMEDMDKIYVLVKGRGKQQTFTNMCRCPHCFHITHGVKIIGNE